MAATQLLTRASTHSTRAFAPQLTASSKGFSSASSASSARSHQTSHLLQSQRLGRHSVATSAIPSWVPFIGKQRKQGNNSVLNWARTTRMACQVAPAKAPSGQDIATFAGLAKSMATACNPTLKQHSPKATDYDDPDSDMAGRPSLSGAGGCFWGVELAFQRVPGVTKTSVGYTAGHDKAPTYNSVCSGQTGHTEAVQVYYDPKETDYTKLLDCFFQHVDPTTLNQQGGDRGTQYRSGIYYHNEEQKQAAEKAIAEVNKKLQSNAFRRVMGTKVVSELEPASDYYSAEEYHQQYLEKGGRFSSPQSAAKGATERIRCYG